MVTKQTSAHKCINTFMHISL